MIILVSGNKYNMHGTSTACYKTVTCHAMCSARPGARRGKKQRRSLWAAAAQALAAPLDAARSPATTPARGEEESGTGTTGYEVQGSLKLMDCWIRQISIVWQT